MRCLSLLTRWDNGPHNWESLSTSCNGTSRLILGLNGRFCSLCDICSKSSPVSALHPCWDPSAQKPPVASHLSPSSPIGRSLTPSAPARMNDIQEATSPATSLSGPAACVSKVELRVSCKALLDRDTLNKSDPCVILMVQTNGQWTEVSPSLKTCDFSSLFLSVHPGRKVSVWYFHTQFSTFISLIFTYRRYVWGVFIFGENVCIPALQSHWSGSTLEKKLSWFGECTAVFFNLFIFIPWNDHSSHNSCLTQSRKCQMWNTFAEEKACVPLNYSLTHNRLRSLLCRIQRVRHCVYKCVPPADARGHTAGCKCDVWWVGPEDEKWRISRLGLGMMWCVGTRSFHFPVNELIEFLRGEWKRGSSFTRVC